MTRPAVYLETSVVGYATSRPSRDLVVAGHQQVTREWFALRARAYELFISQLVVSEASGGDAEAAQERAVFLQGIARLGITDAAGELAAKLVKGGAVPPKAAEDALHVAVADRPWNRLPPDLELQAHRECSHAPSHRTCVQRGRLRAARDLHARGVDE